MQKGIIVHTVLLNKEGKLLILQRSAKNDVLPQYWDIPGGTLEDGEDPSIGAVREIKEETGIMVPSVKLFFQKSNIDLEKNKQFITLVFHAVVADSAVIINPDEHDKYLWINPQSISEYKTVNYLADCLSCYRELSTNPIN